MNKTKIKASAYSANIFILGLTGGWIIPVDFEKPISVVTAIILFLMLSIDFTGTFRKDDSKKKSKTLRTKKEKPPRKRKRKKRRK